MSKTKEILRQKWLLGRSHREVAKSLSVSAGVVGSMLALRQVHKAGEKMFVDFAGMRPSIIDRETGEVTKVESSSRCSVRAATRTPRRSPTSNCRTGSGRTSARSNARG